MHAQAQRRVDRQPCTPTPPTSHGSLVVHTQHRSYGHCSITMESDDVLHTNLIWHACMLPPGQGGVVWSVPWNSGVVLRPCSYMECPASCTAPNRPSMRLSGLKRVVMRTSDGPSPAHPPCMLSAQYMVCAQHGACPWTSPSCSATTTAVSRRTKSCANRTAVYSRRNIQD